MSKTTWTDERVETLKKLWGDGKTASQIAEILGGVTRNAVIGKAHRLNLSKRASPLPVTRKQKVNPRIETPSHVSKGKSISLLEMKERSCRWPNGDPKKADFSFCGLDALPGIPYCGEHASVAYQTNGKKFNVHIDDNIDVVDEEKMIGQSS